jgi:hypothetical protein
MCYWTRGRLSIYNGTPAFRLWKIGTNRILGVHTGPSTFRRDSEDVDNPELPSNVNEMLEPGRNRTFADVFADFEVCTLEPERPRTMQAACIESAKNIRVEK